jgi:uncharacterized protein
MPNPNFAAATDYARLRLERELSPLLTYHNLSHTRDDVVPAARRLARLHGVSAEDLFILLTAAWYHDLGYIAVRDEHESTGAQSAGDELPRFGYTPAQVDVIRQLILSTRLPTAPRNWLEGALADADLHHLGGPKFMEHSDRLRHELAAYGSEFSDAGWLAEQLSFLRAQAFHTNEAQRLWDAGKQKNIALLEQLLAQCAP